MINKIPSQAKEYLLAIYNKSYKELTFPTIGEQHFQYQYQNQEKATAYQQTTRQ